MSRIGKNPIKIPSDISVDLSNQDIVVTGSKGSSKFFISQGFKHY